MNLQFLNSENNLNCIQNFHEFVLKQLKEKYIQCETLSLIKIYNFINRQNYLFPKVSSKFSMVPGSFSFYSNDPAMILLIIALFAGHPTRIVSVDEAL